MKYLYAIVAIGAVAFTCGFAQAKDVCTHEWRKGNYKTHQQIEDELGPLLKDGTILKYSLCTNGAGQYFQVTILEAEGRVRVIKLPAH
jgi:hypothetical protein